MAVAAEPPREELEAAHCWEAVDRAPGRPEMTAFRRAARLHQARWREANGHPMGTHPLRPVSGKASRLLGSRLPLEYARSTGANFVSTRAFAAAQARASMHEREQSIDWQGTWADLLSTTAMCVNLFAGVDTGALRTWWPDLPGSLRAARFAHSPGWLDLAYTGSLVSFDAAFELDLDDGTSGVLAIVARYREALEQETPKPERLARYLEVTRRSGVFRRGAVDAVNGTDLTVTWLEHLLALSMLQHPSRRWSWARLVLVHPEGNTDYAAAGERYGALLKDDATFRTSTLEDLLAAGALSKARERVLRARYVVG